MIPAMLLQPLVENSLMHGIFPSKAIAGQIDIRIGKVESVMFEESPADNMRVSGLGRLLLRVQDNGQGREASKASRHRRYSQSYGMRGITERLLWIKRKFHVSADMQIQDLKDAEGNPCGTAVVLNLPLMELTKKND
jgi:LytS/YehU family sensor histidine kinase